MATHFLEFRTREGLMCLVQAGELASILEGRLTPKGKPTQTVLYITLRNNNRIEVIGETRETMLRRLMSCTGINPVIIPYEPGEPEAALEAAE